MTLSANVDFVNIIRRKKHVINKDYLDISETECNTSDKSQHIGYLRDRKSILYTKRMPFAYSVPNGQTYLTKITDAKFLKLFSKNWISNQNLV